MKRKISRSVKTDRVAHKIQNFEEEIWFDIKQAKAAYLPKHIKLKEKNGEIANTTRRPHILADFFEEKQWGEVKQDDHDNENWPNEKLFDTEAFIRTDEFDIEELETFLKKSQER